jgi:hypothetical protein
MLTMPMLSYGADSTKSSLCHQDEMDVFSFKAEKSNKLASICIGGNDSYMVYRYGTSDHVEMTYPAKLDSTSWSKFSFSGYQRPGGAENDCMGDYSISFKSGSISYTVYQQWHDEDNSYDIGVLVEIPGKNVSIHGVKQTQSGSLVLLDGKAQLPNHNNENSP